MLLVLLPMVVCEITEDFRHFLDSRYGDGSARRFERLDMGFFNYGSFGGRKHSNESIQNQPVVFVHGVRVGVARLEMFDDKLCMA